MRATAIITAFGFTIGWLGEAQAISMFQAMLTGDQEVPSVATSASGFASLALDDAQTRLEITLQLFGLDLDGLQTPGDPSDNVTGLHIHRAPAGANGPIVFGLIFPNSDLNGDLVIDAAAGTVTSAWDLNEGNNTTLAAELPNLFADGLYLNVHTVTHPSGEIRGQITAVVPEPATVILMGLGLVGLGVAGRRKLVS